MKRNIMAAIVVALAGLSVLAYNFWLNKKNLQPKTTATKSITGKWQIENIADSSSSQKNGIGIIAFALSLKDSIPSFAEFNADSSFSVSRKDSVVTKGNYYTDVPMQKVFIKQDSTFDEYSIKSLTDSSAIIVSAKDSVYYTLRK